MRLLNWPKKLISVPGNSFNDFFSTREDGGAIFATNTLKRIGTWRNTNGVAGAGRAGISAVVHETSHSRGRGICSSIAEVSTTENEVDLHSTISLPISFFLILYLLLRCDYCMICLKRPTLSKVSSFGTKVTFEIGQYELQGKNGM